MPNPPRLTLLALLDALGDDLPNLDFQKLLFLYSQSTREQPPYEFVPYRYGAFSFSSYADRRKLVVEGLLASDEHRWKLTDAGALKAKGMARRELATFASKHRSMRGDALVEETYRLFPYYAQNSQIADRFFKAGSKEIAAIVALRPTRRSGLSTVGYQGKSLERFLNQILTASVTVLCDVRLNPMSRKYGFAKSTLEKACEGVGIRYQHRPELGVPSSERQSLQSQADYDRLFRRYDKDTLSAQRGSVEGIREEIKAGQHVAVMCFEELPAQCHRSRVARALEAEGLVAVHL